MRASLIAAGVLFSVIMVITVLFATTGLNTKPGADAWFVPVAIGVQLAVLLGLLQSTAGQNGYGGQVKVGVISTAVAAALILAGSYLLTAVVFPGFYPDAIAAERTRLEANGLTAGEVEAAVAEYEKGRTPAEGAVAGAVGTAATGIAMTLAMAAFIRKR